MRDAMLLVDVLDDFRHEDGDRLLASFRERFPALERRLLAARSARVHVVFANDNKGIWDGDGRALVRRALDGPAGDLISRIAPSGDDRLVVKPRYSAFDHTPLGLILGELETERILLAGTATEMCVAQTAISAREAGLKVTVFADACATVDERNERIALDYLENVVGAVVER
jgi:nicotinamidase-related amidase